MTLRDEASDHTPEIRPPSTDARPEAMRNAPRPVSPYPISWLRVTINAVDSADTRSSERTMTNCRNSRSPVNRPQVSAHQPRSRPRGSSSETGSSMVWNTIAAIAQAAAEAKMRAARIHVGIGVPMYSSNRPTARATAPPTAAARPVITPRRPLEIVRPCTSFDAMEHRDRKTASTASRRVTVRPRARASRSRAATPMSAAATAWPSEPITQMRLRERCVVTHGVNAAWGSIEPASRMGTSRAMKKPGAPAACSSQGRTVLAATIWSPTPCRPFDQMKRRAACSSFAGMLTLLTLVRSGAGIPSGLDR